MAYEYTNGKFSLRSFGQQSLIQIKCHLPPLISSFTDLTIILRPWITVSSPKW